MTAADYTLLKAVLSVKTHTGEEEEMVNFLIAYCQLKGYSYYTDQKNNLYVTKGMAEIYPCVTAHTDTVHLLHRSLHVIEVRGKRPSTFGRDFRDKEKRLFLTGVDDWGNPSGIGGDDKCGIYVCLRLLESHPALKAAFFVSEETGCWGSRVAHEPFFENVGYAVQFDAPGNHLVTELCNGVRLFERDSAFFKIISTTLSEFGDYLYQSHPYTDISQLKLKFNFACLNISCGYYHMHTPAEKVDVKDVEQTVQVGGRLLQRLGNHFYGYVFDRDVELQKEIEQYRKRMATLRNNPPFSGDGFTPDIDTNDFGDFINDN